MKWEGKSLWTSSAKSKEAVDAFAMQYHLEKAGGDERGM